MIIRQRTFFALVCALLLPAITLAQTKREKRIGPKVNDEGAACDTAAWQLVFSDEFDGEALDLSLIHI